MIKTGLHERVRKNELSKLYKEIDDCVNLDAFNKDGDTALLIAIKQKNHSAAQLLLEEGASMLTVVSLCM